MLDNLAEQYSTSEYFNIISKRKYYFTEWFKLIKKRIENI